MNPLAYLIFFLLAIMIAGCNSSAQPTQQAQADAPLIREKSCTRIPDNSLLRKSLQMAAVEEKLTERPIVVPGTVEVDPAKLIKVAPPVSEGSRSIIGALATL